MPDRGLRASARDVASRFSEDLLGALLVTSRDGTILWWNAGATTLFGYAADEVLGRTIFDTIVPADLVDTKRTWLRTAAESGSAIYESIRRRKDGQRIWVEIMVRVHRDSGESVLVLNERDITRIKRERDAEVLQVENALKAVSAELESFTYSVAHDLRAPIRQIDGFSKLLSEKMGDAIDPDAAHYLHRIQEAARKLEQMVDALLLLRNTPTLRQQGP
ncbi:MAG TPA: PAS domain S-box protein [Gemmatimonadaceae bacterium]|nr:PAS domain S-box protein [Gemmatimonadaceae bacterium]